MAKLRSGILGQIRGKVAGVVGGQWKDKNYVREYVKPANPNTAGQQAQRSKFALAVTFAKQLVGPIFNVYVDKFQKSMSGFNFFIKCNIAEFVAPINYEAISLTSGKLFEARITAISASSADNLVTIETSVSLGSNGAVDDQVYLACYNQTSGRWGFADATYNRGDGSTPHTVALVIQPSDPIQAYAISSQLVSGVLASVGNSDHDFAIAT